MEDYRKIIRQMQKEQVNAFVEWLQHLPPPIERGNKNNLAYICSPYRGNIFERFRNIRYARHITKIALDLGYTPITTHLYLTQVLDDKVPMQRRRGLRAGQDILNACGTIIIGARYGVSEGMAAEIKAAKGKNTIIIP